MNPLMGEDRVFTNPDAPSAYKPGDKGDAVMVVVVGMPGKEIPRPDLRPREASHLGPGPHSGSDYGQVRTRSRPSALRSTTPPAAHAFVTALKNAVMLAKTQAMAH